MLIQRIVYLILTTILLIGCRANPAVPPTIPAAWLTEAPTRVIALLPDGTTAETTPTLAVGAPTPVALPATATALPTAETLSTPGATQPPAQNAISISAAPGVPPDLITRVQQFATQDNRFAWSDDPTSAEIILTPRDGTPFASWVFAAAAPFATIPDGISSAELQAGQTAAGPVLLSAETAATFPAFNGQISENPVTAELLWQQRPAVTLLPVDQLTPDLKLLTVDGISPFSAEANPLTLPIGLAGNPTASDAFRAAWNGPVSNFDPAKLTRVAMTGVTALVRATAYNMEQNGILWPGTDIKPVLQTADIAHISNEVAFAPDCPYPNPIGGTTFCSRDSYFALLQDIGTNLVELTGNHVNDWGPENLVRSIEMYEQAGMRTFGGGRNLAEAQAAATYEHHGNRIAFVGCNSFGPEFAFATENGAGSRPCGPAMADMKAQISQLRAEGYLVIATLQYTEFYQYPPTPEQAADFQALIDAGASAVSGSQGHHAQAFDFHNGNFIHYGPGNTFFDQMDDLGTRQTFVDTYHIYDGKLLTVTLWTGLIESYAKPRTMTSTERAQTLQTIFQASGW